MLRVVFSLFICLTFFISKGSFAQDYNPEAYLIGAHISDQYRCKSMKRHQVEHNSGLITCTESFDATPTFNALPDRQTYLLIKQVSNEENPQMGSIHYKGFFKDRMFVDKKEPAPSFSEITTPSIFASRGEDFIIGNIQFKYSVREAATKSVYTYYYYSVQKLSLQ